MIFKKLMFLFIALLLTSCGSGGGSSTSQQSSSKSSNEALYNNEHQEADTEVKNKILPPEIMESIDQEENDDSVDIAWPSYDRNERKVIVPTIQFNTKELEVQYPKITAPQIPTPDFPEFKDVTITTSFEPTFKNGLPKLSKSNSLERLNPTLSEQLKQLEINFSQSFQSLEEIPDDNSIFLNPPGLKVNNIAKEEVQLYDFSSFEEDLKYINSADQSIQSTLEEINSASNCSAQEIIPTCELKQQGKTPWCYAFTAARGVNRILSPDLNNISLLYMASLKQGPNTPFNFFTGGTTQSVLSALQINGYYYTEEQIPFDYDLHDNIRKVMVEFYDYPDKFEDTFKINGKHYAIVLKKSDFLVLKKQAKDLGGFYNLALQSMNFKLSDFVPNLEKLEKHELTEFSTSSWSYSKINTSKQPNATVSKVIKHISQLLKEDKTVALTVCAATLKDYSKTPEIVPTKNCGEHAVSLSNFYWSSEKDRCMVHLENSWGTEFGPMGYTEISINEVARILFNSAQLKAKEKKKDEDKLLENYTFTSIDPSGTSKQNKDFYFMEDIIQFNVGETSFNKAGKLVNEGEASKILLNSDQSYNISKGIFLDDQLVEGSVETFNPKEEKLRKAFGYFKNGKFIYHGNYFESYVDGRLIKQASYKNNEAQKSYRYEYFDNKKIRNLRKDVLLDNNLLYAESSFFLENGEKSQDQSGIFSNQLDSISSLDKGRAIFYENGKITQLEYCQNCSDLKGADRLIFLYDEKQQLTSESCRIQDNGRTSKGYYIHIEDGKKTTIRSILNDEYSDNLI